MHNILVTMDNAGYLQYHDWIGKHRVEEEE